MRWGWGGQGRAPATWPGKPTTGHSGRREASGSLPAAHRGSPVGKGWRVSLRDGGTGSWSGSERAGCHSVSPGLVQGPAQDLRGGRHRGSHCPERLCGPPPASLRSPNSTLMGAGPSSAPLQATSLPIGPGQPAWVILLAPWADQAKGRVPGRPGSGCVPTTKE